MTEGSRCGVIACFSEWPHGLQRTAPAAAFIAYVSNEKSNTVSVIDTDKWAVTKTIKVGQRPRGIEFTQRRQVRDGRGRRR